MLLKVDDCDIGFFFDVIIGEYNCRWMFKENDNKEGFETLWVMTSEG